MPLLTTKGRKLLIEGPNNFNIQTITRTYILLLPFADLKPHLQPYSIWLSVVSHTPPPPVITYNTVMMNQKLFFIDVRFVLLLLASEDILTNDGHRLPNYFADASLD